MSEDHLRTLALEVRNWARGVPTTRSGIGTLNDISPEAIAAAARLATTGKVFALGISLQREGPQRRRGCTPGRSPTVAGDNDAAEVRPSEIAGFRNPSHILAIPNMASPSARSSSWRAGRDCAADGRYAFLLVAPPLPVTRGVGTPINPYAIEGPASASGGGRPRVPFSG